MKKNKFAIQQIPAIVWGEPSEAVYLFVHGKMSKKEEAEGFAAPPQRAAPARRVSNSRQLQAQWQAWSQVMRMMAGSLGPGERAKVETLDGRSAEITRDNVEEVIATQRPVND